MGGTVICLLVSRPGESPTEENGAPEGAPASGRSGLSAADPHHLCCELDIAPLLDRLAAPVDLASQLHGRRELPAQHEPFESTLLHSEHHADRLLLEDIGLLQRRRSRMGVAETAVADDLSATDFVAVPRPARG